jgi:hypothetical protein
MENVPSSPRFPYRLVPIQICVLAAAALTSCGDQQAAAPADPDRMLAQSLSDTLTRACPTAAPDDEAARRSCADALTDAALLRERMVSPFVWGGQSKAENLDLEKNNRTEFNPRIWRRLYLSTFMFSPGFTLEKDGETTIIRVPVRFRNQLDPGAFPYPFWHSADKWTSYETAREILFFAREGKLVGAVRSADRDPGRPHRDMKWDGHWTWEDSAGLEPRVSLFSNGFSPGNPHVPALETAYRDLEREMRKETCMTCHSPDNSAKMNPLELFSYPNQALSGRHNLVAVLKANAMPPMDATRPNPGIESDDRRQVLIELAKKFEEAGDAALASEHEPVIAAPKAP